MRPYAEKLTELLQNLSATLEGDDGNLLHWSEKVLVVAITF
jgi:F-type H+-transporting ATPase subunit gamma